MRMTTDIFAILMTGAAFGQAGPTSSRFVAADVHLTPREEFSFSNRSLAPGKRIILRGLTLIQMIAAAYGVDEDKVSGGPKWLDENRFDVIAKPPTTTATTPELQAMLQMLLEERFQLKARREDRPFPVYVWTAAKNGLHLTPSKSETEGDCESQPGNGFLVQNCSGMTIEELGRQARIFANGYFNRDVVDRTSAKGKYDFPLKWSGRGQLGRSPDAISLYDVLEKQFGIKTGEDTVALPAVVVQSANETPSPNPRDTDALLPPMPTEFEVATIKIDKDPQAKENFRFVGGRLDLRAIRMKDIIQFAFGIDDDDGGRAVLGRTRSLRHGGQDRPQR